MTGRPEKPRWGCSQVGTEKAKTFHGGCSHVWNVGLSEDCPLRLPDLRLTAHFRLAPDSGFCAALTHLTSSRTFTTVAVPLLSTGWVWDRWVHIWKWFGDDSESVIWWTLMRMPRGWAPDSSFRIWNGTQMWEQERQWRRENSRDPEE